MKLRASILLLILFLWTLVPGIGAACGGAVDPTGCAEMVDCGCCEAAEPCVCAAPAAPREEAPVVATTGVVKPPLLLPSQPMWQPTADAVVAAAWPARLAPPGESSSRGSVQARFCTFLL